MRLMAIRPVPLTNQIFQSSLKWKAKLNPRQLVLAARLADKLEDLPGPGKFNVSFIKDFEKLSVPGQSFGFSFDAWLTLATRSESVVEKVLGQLITVLRIEPPKTASRRVATGKKEFYVDPKDLPDPIVKALKKLKVSPKRVLFRTGNSVSAAEAGAYGDGYQGFAVTVNLATGQMGNMIESPWGQIIPDRNSVPLPPGGAFIVGQRGGGKPARISYITINPENVVGILPMPEFELSKKELQALKIIATMNYGGRKDNFKELDLGAYGPANEFVKLLVEKGLVKAIGPGVSITTTGKNRSLEISDSILMRGRREAGSSNKTASSHEALMGKWETALQSYVEEAFSAFGRQATQKGWKVLVKVSDIYLSHPVHGKLVLFTSIEHRYDVSKTSLSLVIQKGRIKRGMTTHTLADRPPEFLTEFLLRCLPKSDSDPYL